MDIWTIVCVVVLLVIVYLLELVVSTILEQKNVREQKILAQNVREQDEWLEALLVPSVSLTTLVHSLNTVFPSVLSRHDWINSNDTRCIGSPKDLINLRNTRKLFSDRMLWKLIDVFVRNADTHFKVLSNNCTGDGASLIHHIMTEIMQLHGSNAMKVINSSSLSEEAKQKLLS